MAACQHASHIAALPCSVRAGEWAAIHLNRRCSASVVWPQALPLPVPHGSHQLGAHAARVRFPARKVRRVSLRPRSSRLQVHDRQLVAIFHQVESTSHS